MRNEFRAFHIANDDEKINILSDEATLFVVDTNVLLDLYSLKEETRKLFFDFLEKSKDRLFLPHHVGLEYHNNRIQIIKKEVEDVSFIENKLFSKIESIFKEESIKNLLNKNPFLSEDIETLKKKVLDITKKDLELIIQKIKDSDNKPIYVNGDDHIKEKIYSIFAGKVGDSFTQEVLDSLYVEGEGRYKDHIPPGYADSPQKGEEEFIFSDIRYKRKFGDLIIWKQIIKFIQNSDKEVKNVVFISGEKKKDWANVVDSQGAKNLGARHELVEEIQREARVEKFILLSHEDYMRLGDKAFGITVSNAILEDIEEHGIRHSLQIGSPLEENEERNFNKLAQYQNLLKSYGINFKKLNEVVAFQNQLKDYDIDFNKLDQMYKYQNKLKSYGINFEKLNEIVGYQNHLRDLDLLAQMVNNKISWESNSLELNESIKRYQDDDLIKIKEPNEN